jgi:hypothetical protein
MPEKPKFAAGYPPDQIARVTSTCLYLATKLGDLMDELVVVGGLVPSLLIDPMKYWFAIRAFTPVLNKPRVFWRVSKRAFRYNCSLRMLRISALSK